MKKTGFWGFAIFEYIVAAHTCRETWHWNFLNEGVS
jgi:hypothetical protein